MNKKDAKTLLQAAKIEEGSNVAQVHVGYDWDGLSSTPLPALIRDQLVNTGVYVGGEFHPVRSWKEEDVSHFSATLVKSPYIRILGASIVMDLDKRELENVAGMSAEEAKAQMPVVGRFGPKASMVDRFGSKAANTVKRG